MMSNHKRGSGKRIYNRFKHWSVDDCACERCINYAGKGKPCPLEKCCIEDIREEAIRREAEAAATAANIGGV